MYIREQALPFFDYLMGSVLSENARFLLDTLMQRTDVYIFSGVIRNFLLGFTENRDMDIVVADLEAVSFDYPELRDCRVSRNSFGGYKAVIDGIYIDIWSLETTWGIQIKGMRRNPYSLIKTAFFNFSAIVFDLKKKRFIYDEGFCSFLRTRTMDVVLPENPNIALCILNTIYYAKKYKFPLSYRLCAWVRKRYDETLPFEDVEQAHFHKSVVSTDDRAWFNSIVSLLIDNKYFTGSQNASFDFVQKTIEINSLEPAF